MDKKSKFRWLWTVIIFVIGIIVSFVIWHLVRQSDLDKTRVEVAGHCNNLAAKLNVEIARRNAILRAISLFYADGSISNRLVSEHFLKTHLCKLLGSTGYFDIESVGWAPFVQTAQVDEFLQRHDIPCIKQIQTPLLNSFENMTAPCANTTTSGPLFPVLAYCTNIITPDGVNVTGVDINSFPLFATAIATDLFYPPELITLTEPIQDINGTNVVFQVQIAYEGPDPQTIDERQRWKRGVFFAAIIPDSLFRYITVDYSAARIRLWTQNKNLIIDKYINDGEQLQDWAARIQLRNMDTPLTLECIPYADNVQNRISPLSWVVLAFLLFSSAAVAGLFHLYSAERAAVVLMRHSQTEKEQAFVTRRTYFAFVVHELRSPLQSILSMVEFAEDLIDVKPSESSPPSQQQMPEIIQSIRFATESMLVIVNDLLDLDRLEQGKLQIERVPFNPYYICNQIRGTYESILNKKGVVLKMVVEDTFNRHFLGDPIRFTQILRNLLSNAVKFTSKGEVSVSCSSANRDIIIPQLPKPNEITDDDELARVEVKDTGIGIPAARLTQLFQPYTQANGSTTRIFGGSGLGLAIVRQITMAMNGLVLARSEEGVGSDFAVILPLRKTDTVPAVEAPMREFKTPSEPTVEQKHYILICEDNMVNQKILKKNAELLGYTVDIADNGRAGIDKAMAAHLRQQPYSLILMDYHMPILNGDQAIAELRSKGITAPIIAISGGESGEQAKLMQAGATDFLPKPMTRPVYQKMLKKYLR